jgi:hypothetical protein
MIARVSRSDQAGASGSELCPRSGYVETDTRSRPKLRLRDAEQLSREHRVGLASVQISVRAHCSDVRGGSNRRGLFSGRLSVGAGRARICLRRVNPTERSEVEKVLLNAATNVDRVDRTENLTLWVEQRWIARSGRKIDAQRGSVERSTRLLHVAAHIRKQIRSTRADPRLRFVGPEAAALGERALLRGETPCVAEAE